MTKRPKVIQPAQNNFIAQWIAENESAWFGGIPIPENTDVYFLSRTCDILDLSSFSAGTNATYYAVWISHRRENENVQRI